MDILTEITALFFAACLVMILHELPKSIIYVLTGRHCLNGDRVRIFNPIQYIDPIGILLFIMCHAGYSRPYPYRLKEKDTNIAIGMTGFFTLIVLILSSSLLYKHAMFSFPSYTRYGAFIQTFCIYFLYASIVLLILNIIPATCSDMFLLLVGIRPSMLVLLLKNETLIKGIVLLFIILNFVSGIGISCMNRLLLFYPIL